MTIRISRKKFLDLGLGTVGAIGLGACFQPRDNDGAETLDDTGSTGGDDDDTNSNSNPSSPTSDPDDDGSSSDTVDPSGSSSTDPTAESSTSIDPTADSSATDADSSSGPGEESSSTGTAEGCTDDPSVVIANNHMHVLVVPLADVEAGVDVDYDIQGGSAHSHIVTLTAEHFAALQAGEDVMVVSTSGGMHTHSVTVSCA
jgi:hypothetical protein